MPKLIAPRAKAEYVTIRADVAQIERLHELGAISGEQLEQGRAAGGLQVQLPAAVVAEFQNDKALEIERLAQWLHAKGLASPARLMLATGRPLSFFGSQLLLAAQPFSKMLYGQEFDPAGRYSRLLEKRANVDKLLDRLEQLAREKKA